MIDLSHIVPDGFPTDRRNDRMLWWILGISALLLFALLGNIQYQSYLHTDQSAKNRLANSTAVLADLLDERLFTIRIVLDELRRGPTLQRLATSSPQQRHDDLNMLTGLLPIVHTLAIFDAEGNIRFSSQPTLEGRNFAAREYFKIIAAAPDAAITYLSEPFISAEGIQTLSIARAITDIHGRFAGIATAYLDGDDILQQLESMHPDNGSRISLVHADGKLIKIYPPLPQAYEGKDLNQPGSLISRHRDSGSTFNLLTGRSAAVEADSIAALRNVQPATVNLNKPLIIVSARSTDLVFHDWWIETLIRFAILAFMLLAGMLAIGFYQHRQRVLLQLRQERNAASEHTLATLQSFVDHLPGPAYVKDSDGRTLMASAGFKTVLGLDPGEMLGKTSHEVFAGELGEKIFADDLAVMHSKQAITFTEQFDGRWFESTKFVITADNHQPWLGGITLDITQRKNTERQLLERIKELHTLYQMYQVADRSDLTLAETYRMVAEFLPGGWQYPEIATACIRVRGESFCMPGHEPSLWQISAPIRVDAQEIGVVEVCYQAERPACDEGPFLKEERTLIEAVAQRLGLLTTRKEAEEALAAALAEQKALNAKLEAAQVQLLQSEKMASIGQLAAGIAHEINNPVGFVYSNLGSLERYLDDIFAICDACETAAEHATNPGDFAQIQALKKAKDFDFLRQDVQALMKESHDGLERVKKIVLDLKNFSRIGETDWQWADVHEGLESTLNVVWNELKYKCTVSKHYAPDLPKIHCIPSQLNQVFMNLLINAAQSIEDHGEISISTGLSASRPDAVEIMVSDSGRGIAEEHLPHIFEPFFTTKPVGKGTGLGLSIVWGIIGKHDGTITVESTPGVGTRFTITLPISASGDHETQHP